MMSVNKRKAERFVLCCHMDPRDNKLKELRSFFFSFNAPIFINIIFNEVKQSLLTYNVHDHIDELFSLHAFFIVI